MTTAESTAAAVASPCNQVCRIDAASGWCEGCRRSLDEIAAWAAMSDAQKLAVRARLPGRLIATSSSSPPRAPPRHDDPQPAAPR